MTKRELELKIAHLEGRIEELERRLADEPAHCWPPIPPMWPSGPIPIPRPLWSDAPRAGGPPWPNSRHGDA